MNEDQLGLFECPAPYVQDSYTSKVAAKAIEPDASTLRGIVLAFLRGRASLGATDEEMQQLIPMSANTQRPRRIELVERGFVIDSGILRDTKSGRHAVVWIAKDQLFTALQQQQQPAQPREQQ